MTPTAKLDKVYRILNNKKDLYMQEFHTLYESKSVDLCELKLYYLLQLKTLEYKRQNVSDEELKFDLNNRLDTYGYRLASLNEKTLNKKYDREIQLQKLFDYEDRLEEHDSIILSGIDERIKEDEYHREFDYCVRHNLQIPHHY